MQQDGHWNITYHSGALCTLNDDVHNNHSLLPAKLALLPSNQCNDRPYEPGYHLQSSQPSFYVSKALSVGRQPSFSSTVTGSHTRNFSMEQPNYCDQDIAISTALPANSNNTEVLVSCSRSAETACITPDFPNIRSPGFTGRCMTYKDELSNASEVNSKTNATYQYHSDLSLRNAGSKFPSVALSDGQTTKISPAAKRHPLLSPCHCKKLKCWGKIVEECRRHIYQRFWSLKKFDARRQWILDHSNYLKRKNLGLTNTELECRRWYLPNLTGCMTEVCKMFFFRTLGYKWPHVIQWIVPETQIIPDRVGTDQHTKRAQQEEKSLDQVRRLMLMHIKSFLRRHYPYSKIAHKHKRHKIEYGIVKRAFVEFKFFHSSFQVSYQVFRKLFLRIYAQHAINHASVVPKRSNVSSSNSIKTTSENKVIMQLDIENDSVVITKNRKDDSDTEVESQRVPPNNSHRNSTKSCTSYNEMKRMFVPYLFKNKNMRLECTKIKHPFLTLCRCKCRCFEKIPETRRKVIYEYFWSLEDDTEQKHWLLQHTERTAPQHQIRSRKRRTASYFLMDENGQAVSVCSVFFQRTLGFKENFQVDTFCEPPLSDGKITIPGQLEGKDPASKLNTHVTSCVKQHIINHFNSRATDCKEKPGACWPIVQLNVFELKQLYADFEKAQPQYDVSYEQFRIIYHNVCKAPKASLGSDLNYTTLNSSVHGSKKTKPLNRSKFCADQKYSELPQRRRSTRKNRMQGSMSENSLLELRGESKMVSSIVSFHENIGETEKSGTTTRSVSLKFFDPLPSAKINNPAINLAHLANDNNLENTAPVSNSYQDPKCGRKACQKARKRDQKYVNPKRHGRKSKKTWPAAADIEETSTSRRIVGDDSKLPKKHSKLKALKKKHQHPMLPSCNCSRRKCIEKIPEEQRKEIHSAFWNMENYKDRKHWLARFVERRDRKVKALTLFPQRKNESKKYFLPDKEGKTVEVCRLFFIHTMGFKWHSVVDLIAKAKRSNRALSKGGYVLKRPWRELPDHIVNSVKQYIESLRESAQQTNGRSFPSILQPETAGESLKECQIFDSSDFKGKALPKSANASEIKNSSNNKPQVNTTNAFKCFDASKLKVKDLFNDYRIKYKNLKFNLGYQSFRRIFQSVVDPVQEVICGRKDSERSFIDSDEMEEECRDRTPDIQLVPTSFSKQKNATAKLQKLSKHYLKSKSEKSHLKILVKRCKNSSGIVNGDVISCDDVNEIKGSKDITSEQKEITEQNSSSNSLEVANDGEKNADECILDVGSGYLKRTTSGTSTDLKYPFSYECKHQKRRSLSMRNNRSNYPVLPPCKCTKRKCAEKFTHAQRQKINDMFWSLNSYNERKQWILENIKRENIKRRVVFTKGTPRKLESRWYYLPLDDGKKVDVCKDFFLRTLGYRWDSVIDTIGKTTPKGERFVTPDKRGKKPPPHKISEEAVSSMSLYIESVCHTYQPIYQKKKQNLKKGSKFSTGNLVTYGLTMKQLFEDYKSKHPNHKFGYESFRKVFHRVHSTIMASLPSLPESSEEPEQMYSDEAGLAEQDFSESTHIKCSNAFQSQTPSFIPTTEAYPNINLYTPSVTHPPPPAPPQLIQSHHPVQELPQPSPSTAPERSCLYQHSSQFTDTHQPPHLPPVPGSENGLQGQNHYNTVDHEPFTKLNHNLYAPHSVIGGASAPFSQAGDPLEYNGSQNLGADVVDPSSAEGQNQFTPYLVPNPEPLRRQVYHMASHYQSFLHHIAESSRFLNYGSFPPPDATFQCNNQDKQYPYTHRQDFYRDSLNSYNLPKSSHNCMAEPFPVSNHYAVQNHIPSNMVPQDTTCMVISPYSDENDNSFMHGRNQGPCLPKEQDLTSDLGNHVPSISKDDKSGDKGRSANRNCKIDQPKVKKEKRIRPKSSRNYGDHYPMLPPCNCKKRKCTVKFPEASRQRVHDMFWHLKNYNERKQWMLLHIKREECKRRRIDQHESSRKQESRWYYFPDESGNLQEVCKDFFLRTLGYRWDSVIDTIRRTTPKGETSSRPDQRGRKPPAHKLSSAVMRSVVQYIQSMQQVSLPASHEPDGTTDQSSRQVISSQGSSNTDNSDHCNSATQVCIPYGLTMKDLYDDYKVKHTGHKIGYESFRRIFRALSRSEKIVIDEHGTEDDILNPDNHNLVDF